MSEPRMRSSGDGDELLLSMDAAGEWWQLGPLPPQRGAFLLVGWPATGDDGGVPPAIVDALARAFVRFGRVTFPSSKAAGTRASRWTAYGDDHIAAYASAGVPRALLTLRSTLRASAVRELFDDAAHPWWYQGQFALLSRDATRLPDLRPYAALLPTLLEPEWTEALPVLADAGIDAIVRPGVDGDVCGIVCSSVETREAVEACLSRAASEAGMACRLLDEDAFAQAVAGS